MVWWVSTDISSNRPVDDGVFSVCLLIYEFDSGRLECSRYKSLRVERDLLCSYGYQVQDGARRED